MTTLVIHPADYSTDFLKDIYKGKEYSLISTNMSKSKICKMIKDHDRIIMMGHGSEDGLIGFDRFIINSSHVYLLREKECIYIWCNADKFVEKYKLKSHLFTGMIISEDIEANLFCINSTMEYMDESNHRFAIAIRNVIDDNPIDIRDIKGNYLVSCNPVICFNRKNIFSNKN